MKQKPAASQTTATIEQEVTAVAGEVIEGAERIVTATSAQLEETVAPIRRSILKRFPVLFLLAVTFGFTATITGIEQLLIRHELLQAHPGVILALGISVLILTGTLYKKLG